MLNFIPRAGNKQPKAPKIILLRNKSGKIISRVHERNFAGYLKQLLEAPASNKN